MLGWNKATQDGSFTNDFVKQDEGKKVSDTLVAQGADIVMPVAGGTGQGTTAAAQASGGKFNAIWVDVDGCESTQNCPALVTTVVKNISDAVRDAVTKAAKGEKLAHDPGYIGTLANNGVSLAPYHDFDSKVPAELKAEVDKLKADIIAGTDHRHLPGPAEVTSRPAIEGENITSGDRLATARAGRSGARDIVAGHRSGRVTPGRDGPERTFRPASSYHAQPLTERV